MTTVTQSVLDAAADRTAAVNADPAASAADREAAAAAEAELYDAFPAEPVGAPGLELYQADREHDLQWFTQREARADQEPEAG